MSSARTLIVIRLVEIVLGVVFIYFGLEKFSAADQFKGVLFGLLAIAGLVLAVHGVLLYLVPNFFAL